MDSGVVTVPRTAQEAQAAAERFERFRAPETPESGEPLSPGHIEAHLRLETHRIEKGLSVAEPRRPFGQLAQQRIERLLALAAELTDKHAGLVSAERQAQQALEAWRGWNSPAAQDLARRGCAVVRPLESAQTSDHIATDDRAALLTEFFTARSSVRSFDPRRPVGAPAIEHAVRIALNTPSVCNRATGRVHVYRGAAQTAPLLELQQGNRGLTGVHHLAVVTVELSMFAGVKEFAQPWIDGGLFLMNLTWGFQVQGVGACLLNWSMPEAASRQLRAVADIPESELVVCLLAFGYPAPGAHVTRSDKPPLSAVMTVHEEPAQGPDAAARRSAAAS